MLFRLISCDIQVDAGHVYGDNLERQLDLRLLKDGKLKYQVNRNHIPNELNTLTWSLQYSCSLLALVTVSIPRPE